MPLEQLPERLPPEWLEQIKQVVHAEKPQVWKILLSSSLAAALLGGVFAYVTTRVNIAANREQMTATIAANRELEMTKARNELQKETIRSRVLAYKTLLLSLKIFVAKLEGFERLVEIAGRDRVNQKTAAHIREELMSVGKAEGDVEAARSDPLLDGSHTQQIVEECLKGLTPALAEAKRNPSVSIPQIQAAIVQIRKLTPEIQRAQEEISAIH